MAYQNLNKLFVRVPASVTAELIATIIADSHSTYQSKIYFLEGKNQIVNNGITYGIDPSTARSISDLQELIGASKLANDSSTVIERLTSLEAIHVADDSSLYLSVTKNANNEPVLAANIVTLESDRNGLADAKNVKAYIDSQSLAATPIFEEGNGITIADDEDASTGQVTYTIGADLTINYVPQTNDSSAHITLTNGNKDVVFGSIPVSDIIKNGVLQGTSYNKDTGILSLTFNEADGTPETYEIDLHEMLDINDMKINSDSSLYLSVALSANSSTNGEDDGSQAVFSAIIQDVSTATANSTGLVDAWQAKQYIDSKSTNLAVTAEGDAYVSAEVDAQTDNKHVIVETNVEPLSVTAGTVGVYDASGAQTTAPTSGTLSGTANSLADAADIASKVKTYVDGEVAIEAARADANVKNSIYVLDSSANDTGTNVYVKVTEEHGLVTGVEVTEQYAEISYDGTTWTNTVNASTGLATGQHIQALKDYVDDQTTEVAVSGQGDNYVNLALDATNHKQLNASINTGTLTVTTTAGSDSTITGTQNTLIDGSELATKVSSYVEARLDEEVEKLDASVIDADSKGYIDIEVVEANGKLTSTTIDVSYGTFDSLANGVATTEDVQTFVDQYDFWENYQTT